MKNLKKPLPDDWRRQGQELNLTGAKFYFRTYKPYRIGWDHDHCAFCSDKFSQNKTDHTEGYCTIDEYYWICSECYHDFKDEFKWEIG